MPPIQLSVFLFHCSLYRGHIIARAAIYFGNLELYFLAEQQQDITEYDEQLVRRLIEKITVYDEVVTVEFKSGTSVDVRR